MRHLLVASLVLVGLVAGAGCDDDTEDQAQETIEDIESDLEDTAGQASARSIAEALRSLMLEDDGEQDLRSVEGIQENLDDLPGDPEVTGIDDANGDGLDDDGRVEVRVGDQAACLVISGDEIDVENRACA